MLKSAGGGAGVWVVVNVWFPDDNLSLLWSIDTKLGVWIIYVKRRLGIDTQVSVIKVNVTIAKKIEI